MTCVLPTLTTAVSTANSPHPMCALEGSHCIQFMSLHNMFTNVQIASKAHSIKPSRGGGGRGKVGGAFPPPPSVVAASTTTRSITPPAAPLPILSVPAAASSSQTGAALPGDRPWSSSEQDALQAAMKEVGAKGRTTRERFVAIAERVPGRSMAECVRRYKECAAIARLKVQSH